jgi:hypothetical protein
MSAKPYHAGHDALVRLASFECQQVVVFVSTSDRVRKGEFPVRAETMAKIWVDIVESLPNNVTAAFVSNPVAAVYEYIGARNSDTQPMQTDEVLVVYSDPVDMDRNFPERSMVKYGGALVNAKRLSRRHVPRNATVDVSGTQMRAWLQHGDKAAFVSKLPAGLDGDAVWDALRKR